MSVISPALEDRAPPHPRIEQAVPKNLDPGGRSLSKGHPTQETCHEH